MLYCIKLTILIIVIAGFDMLKWLCKHFVNVLQETVAEIHNILNYTGCSLDFFYAVWYHKK